MIDNSPVKTNKKIRNFLINHLEESGQDGFVVGVSGGIDSAVTARICATVQAETHLASMPIDQKNEGDLRAKNLLKKLEDKYADIHTHIDDLSDVAIEFESMLGRKDISDGLTKANLRSRLRMCHLYSLANHHDLLVVGTGNKVEDKGVGFFTKYGDGGVDVAPIADLYKTEVRDMARYFGLPSDIINAEPTDGLWEDNRTDEEQLGMSYEEMEKFMRWDEQENVEPAMQIESAEELQKYKKYRQMHESTRHKMSTPPICEMD